MCPCSKESSVRGFYLSRWGIFVHLFVWQTECWLLLQSTTSLASRQIVIDFKLLLDIRLMGECISKAVTSERSGEKQWQSLSLGDWSAVGLAAGKEASQMHYSQHQTKVNLICFINVCYRAYSYHFSLNLFPNHF